MSKEKNINRMSLLKDKKKQRQQQNDIKQIENELQYKITKQIDDSNVNYKLNKKTDNKVSTAILDFIKVLYENTASDEEKELMIAFAIVTWNSGVIKASGRIELYETFIKEYEVFYKNELKGLFDLYVEYKINKFPDYNNLVMQYDFTINENGLANLSVASSKFDF